MGHRCTKGSLDSFVDCAVGKLQRIVQYSSNSTESIICICISEWDPSSWLCCMGLPFAVRHLPFAVCCLLFDKK